MKVPGPTVLMVKERLAGEASKFPTASLARTSKVCGPFDRPAARVYGEVHAANASESKRHSKPAVPVLPLNSKVGVSSAVVPEGPAVMVVSGGVVSTVKERLAGVG